MNDQLDHSYTAKVLMLVYSLSVKLSPCLSGHSSSSSCTNRRKVSICGML